MDQKSHVLLVFNQGNFNNMYEIIEKLKTENHIAYMPENSLVRNHKTDISTMTDNEIADYIRFIKNHIREMDCILVVNNELNMNTYDIDSIARLKISLAINCSKPVFIFPHDFYRISKKDSLPVLIKNLEEISLKYPLALQQLKIRRQAIKEQQTQKQKEKEKLYKVN